MKLELIWQVKKEVIQESYNEIVKDLEQYAPIENYEVISPRASNVFRCLFFLKYSTYH